MIYAMSLMHLSVETKILSLSFNCTQIRSVGDLITVRKRSCGKVIFSHLSVNHSVHREGMHGKGAYAWQGGHA